MPSSSSSNHLKRLYAAREKVAKLVVADLVYLPIFERLEAEIAAEEAAGDAIERARALVARQRATG